MKDIIKVSLPFSYEAINQASCICLSIGIALLFLALLFFVILTKYVKPFILLCLSTICIVTTWYMQFFLIQNPQDIIRNYYNTDIQFQSGQRFQMNEKQYQYTISSDHTTIYIFLKEDPL